MYNRLGVFKGLVYKFESNIAREGTAGLCRVLGGVELIALNLGSGKAVGIAFLVADLVVVLKALAALVNIGSGYITRSYAGVLVDEGYGVAAVSRYGAGCLALCSDELVVIENAAVGVCAVGAALSVLGGLGLENRAAVGNMVYCKFSVTPRLLKLPVSVRTSEPLAGTLTLLPETVPRLLRPAPPSVDATIVQLEVGRLIE